MTLIDRALRWLYLLAGALTTYCATISARAGAPWYTAAFLAVTALLITADVRDYVNADQLRAAAVRAERVARLKAREDEQRMREDADALAARHTPLTSAEVLGTDSPAAEAEQLIRWGRRESLLVLVTRIQRGRTLTDDEARTLRQHVETEMREAETARAIAAGNLKHVRILIPELEQAQAAIGRAEDLAARWGRALAPDKSYARALRRALGGSEQPTTQKDSA
ncbi:hypothetical protein ACFY30_22135 [Streptomyces sp. NPDC000345]|uniref:hypothetical protein n=1 Tax=Streptomyces sp. NPDC000345 TaxID=3364537 RepID=UPI003678201D